MSYQIIKISFLRSSSSNFALQEVQKNPTFKEDNKTYSASYTKEQSADMHKLLDLLKGCRNRRVFVDDQELPWDEVFHYIECYRSRQKAYDPIEYCSGDAHQYPAFNPWCCIQVAMPFSNNTMWLCYGKFDSDGTWIFDKQKITHYLKTNIQRFRFCSALDMDFMMKVLNAFPETANPKIDKNWEYASVQNKHLVVSINSSAKSFDPQYYCGVRPSSPKAVKNIYQKILNKPAR